MSEHTTDNEEERLPTTPESEDQSLLLVAEIVVFRDRPAECTVFPPDATDFERMTAWITAQEGSFVGLDEMQ